VKKNPTPTNNIFAYILDYSSQEKQKREGQVGARGRRSEGRALGLELLAEDTESPEDSGALSLVDVDGDRASLGVSSVIASSTRFASLLSLIDDLN